MDLTRELQAEEARAAVEGLSKADGGLPAGREFYYEIVGKIQTIEGLLVDSDDEGITLADVRTAENTHRKLSWGDVVSVAVRGHGLPR
jgi:hypothetical protein